MLRILIVYSLFYIPTALKSAETGKYILNPGRRRSEPHDFIVDGARFTYDISGSRERLVSKGPIGKELHLMVCKQCTKRVT